MGILMLAIPLYDIWEDVQQFGWRLSVTLAENALFLLLAGTLVAGGVWLVRTDLETAQVTQIARRTVGATVVIGLLIGWTGFVQALHQSGLKPGILALNGILVGAVTAFGLSVTSVRASAFRKEAVRERSLNDRLEVLYRAARRLEAATTHGEAYDIVEDAVKQVTTGVPFRVVVDGMTVVEHGHPRGPTDPVETVAIGGRGRVELFDEPLKQHEVVTVELFAAYLGATIQRIEREERIREERDILEFVNRTLRHDLLGDLSLVQARLRMLDRNATFEDDRHAEHVDVALDRTEEMDEFVNTMRTYMRSVLEDDHSLEALPLGPVIDEHVAAFREAHPAADIDRGPVPEVPVLADDLIDRVVVNLLANAIEHHDRSDPHVEVEADLLAHEDIVRLRVADDGPGISAARRSSIFEQGERGSDSDGSGFGLHLVKDVVENYGGEVRVCDNEPRGSVFEVDLPVAK